MIAFRYDTLAPDMTEGAVDLLTIERAIVDIFASHSAIHIRAAHEGGIDLVYPGARISGGAYGAKLQGSDVRFDIEPQILAGFGSATGLREVVSRAYPNGLSAIFSANRYGSYMLNLFDLGDDSGDFALISTDISTKDMEISAYVHNGTEDTPGNELFNPDNVNLLASFLSGLATRRP